MKFFIIFLLFITSVLYSQENKISWQRGEQEVIDLQLFRSTHAINLPTTETLQKGDFEFEISHRFLPTIKSGSKELWGFDGPVNIRLALGYGITDWTFVTLGRSNLNDNLDLWLKQKVFEIRNDLLPTVIGARLGAAWNTQVPNRSSGHSRNFQYYGQIIVNTLIKELVGIGIVPSYVHNSNITCPDVKHSFTLGTIMQYYFVDRWSFVAEWNFTVTGVRNRHNPVAFGVELETGGHFFKVILSNSSYLNPSQYLAGADLPVDGGNWRIGFNITRLLSF